MESSKLDEPGVNELHRSRYLTPRVQPDVGGPTEIVPSRRQERDILRSAMPVDRVGALWRAKWAILIVVVIVAGLTYLGAKLIPPTFSSTAQLSIGVVASAGSSPRDAINAGNDLAAQYAQLVTSQPVIAGAAAQLAVDPAQLGSMTSAGTVASQNIIRITAQSGTPAGAQKSAAAVAESFVAYIQNQNREQTSALAARSTAQLSPLNQQILSAQSTVSKTRLALEQASGGSSQLKLTAIAAELSAAQSLLNTLVDRKAAVVVQLGLQSAALTPNVEVIGGSTAANQVAPEPELYTLIAALVALLLAGQVAIVSAGRKR